MSHPILTDMQAKVKKTIEYTQQEFNTIHTGKASPAMVETVMVEAYGSTMRLKECAAISTPDSRLIQIQPWDASLTKPIEKAIQTANLGFNPLVDGKLIRIPLPEMSRERRQEFAKVANKLAEEGRVNVRNVRHGAMDSLKKAEGISKDDRKRHEKEVQTMTDEAIKEINQHLANKEQELLEI